MSAADKLMTNVNLSTISKAKDLKQRLLFTLFILIVFRVGTFIPLPGIDPQVLKDVFSQHSGGVLGMFDMFAGGALSRMTIFALNIMPYITASIILQLMSGVSENLKALKKEGESGRQKINQYTRYLTVLICAVQAYGIAVGLEGMSSSLGTAVANPGLFFRFTIVVTLVGGTMLVVWLGEQITARGVGQGASLLIFAGIVANLPAAFAGTVELGRVGQLSPLLIIAILALAVVAIGIIVFFERAQRRVIIQYPRRQVGQKIFGGESTHLPLKLNTANVIPPIFASAILLMPITIANFSTASGGPEWWSILLSYLQHGQPLYLLLYSSLIAFFCFFYTAIVFNPTDTADNLKRHGGFIPGIRPGEQTAFYLDYILTRLTTVGAIYLVLICLLPELLISKFSVPFYLGGTTLLIVCNVTLDTFSQIQAHLIAHQYEGLLKKTNLKGRFR